MQGSTDAGNHFQSETSKEFSFKPNLLPWLDDFLRHAANKEELLGLIDSFLGLCEKYNLKIHAEKIQVFLTSAEFCGRIIDKDGMRFHPRNLNALLEMRKPEFASDLQQFYFPCNWMRNSIPAFSETIAPLHNLLEDCYKRAKKRTKSAIRKITLNELWGAEHDLSLIHI